MFECVYLYLSRVDLFLLFPEQHTVITTCLVFELVLGIIGDLEMIENTECVGTRQTLVSFI